MKLIQTAEMIRLFCCDSFQECSFLKHGGKASLPFLIYCSGEIGVEWCWPLGSQGGAIYYNLNSNRVSFSSRLKDMELCQYAEFPNIKIYQALISLPEACPERQTVLEIETDFFPQAVNFPFFELPNECIKKLPRMFPLWALNTEFDIQEIVENPLNQKAYFKFFEKLYRFPQPEKDNLEDCFLTEITPEQLEKYKGELNTAFGPSESLKELLFVKAIGIKSNGEPDIKLGFKKT